MAVQELSVMECLRRGGRTDTQHAYVLENLGFSYGHCHIQGCEETLSKSAVDMAAPLRCRMEV